jgi:hypothetical protein
MTDRSMIRSLFDFSFSHFITPKLTRILYILMLVVCGVGAVAVFVALVALGSGFFAKVGALLIGVPIAGLVFFLAAIYCRVLVELVIVAFRGVEYLRDIANATQSAPVRDSRTAAGVR